MEINEQKWEQKSHQMNEFNAVYAVWNVRYNL